MRVIAKFTTILICCIPLSAAADKCEYAPRALEVASKIRNLKILSPVECAALDKQRYRALLSRFIEKDLDLNRLTEHGRILFFLGLIPESYNYKNCIVDALAVNAAAFYSSHLKFFIVPDWIETPPVILVHESVHALQDQHFDLKRFGSKKFLFDDENVAHGALLEGDAMIVEEEFLKGDEHGGVADADISGQLPLADHSCALPAALMDIFQSAYQDGADFVRAKKQKGGFNLLNSLFATPVNSTRRILSPDSTNQPSMSSTPWPYIISGSIGQIGLRALLSNFKAKKESKNLFSSLVEDSFSYTVGDVWDFNASWHFTNPQKASETFLLLKNFWLASYPASEQSEISIRFKTAVGMILITLKNEKISIKGSPIV